MRPKSIAPMMAVAWIVQSARGQTAAPATTAGEVLKNIQVLKDVPMSEWNDTMNFMVGALGAGCQHCHVTAFDKDDQKAKQTARAMIKMTREVNAANFGGRAVVTCNTCHQGSLHPKAMPTLFTKSAAAVRPEKPNAQPTPGMALPDVDQVMANYRKAVGPDVRTLHLKGTVDTSNPGALPFEIDLSVPDKVALRVSIAGAESAQVFNGDRGWTLARGTTTELTPENMASGKLLMDSIRPAKFLVAPSPRKVTGIENIGGRNYAVVESRSAKLEERLYFDTQSGLLYKRQTEAHTTLGSAPSEILFEDYRDVNGVKLPYLMSIRTMSNQADYKFSEIQPNVAIDPARFEKPSTEPKE